MPVAERHESLTAAFEAFRRDAAFGPDWLARSREAAFDRFLERGFPTTREEDWRFTNVAPIAATAFARRGCRGAGPRGAGAVPVRRDADGGPRQRPRVRGAVHGRVAAWPDDRDAPGRGSERIGRSAAGDWERRADAIRRSERAPSSRTWSSVHVAPKTVLPVPLHVLSVVVPGPEPSLVAPRLAIEAGEASQVSIVESYATLGAGVALVVAVTDVRLDAGAVVDHVKIQRESANVFHLASTFVTLGRTATFRSRAVTFGGRIARNDIVAVLDGEGAECTLNGLYLANGETLVDTHTTIDHAQPHCPSHEVYKGILAGRSRAVFNGKIIVRPDAQKTDAKQTNKALLLTDDAQINTKPQLEIFADDVKCTHGAAIGQLDEDAMFYLRARGIAEVDARSLLIHAFAGEILEEIAIEPVRERVQRVMEEKLSIA